MGYKDPVWFDMARAWAYLLLGQGQGNRGISLPSTARMCSNLPHENVIIWHFQEKISLFSFFMVENTKNFDRKLCGHRIYQRKAYLEYDVRIWFANRTNEVVLCLHPAKAAIA